ncbi:MAG: LacI family DNA-binding transcriptional regulator, partial [Kiritimatiellae bacterium]|nr:LacI family DNA-binding transcriptional regulator [Kiritimatiellia bacterium]
MKHRITMRDIAADLELSVQAVSLALRGRAGVSDVTRKRVQTRATELGYVPDPGLRALADYRTRGRQAATRWNRVALVHNWPEEQGLFESGFYSKWYHHLESAALERGIRIEAHWLGAENERTDSVFRTLRNRGVSGVFVAPPAMTSTPSAIRIPTDSFQVVTFGPEHLYPEFHTVQFDFYENLRLAWRMLGLRGHKRIGLVYARNQG